MNSCTYYAFPRFICISSPELESDMCTRQIDATILWSLSPKHGGSIVPSNESDQTIFHRQTM